MPSYDPNRFTEAIEQLEIDWDCPSCKARSGRAGWMFSDAPFVLPVEGGAGTGTATAAFACLKCGFIRLYNPAVAVEGNQ